MISWYKPHFWGKEKEYVNDALTSTWISDGKYVKKLEEDFAHLISAKSVISTSNGTSSLFLSYLALGIGPGDEVIVPGFTFSAPINMVLATGATPIYTDVDPETWLLCPKSIERNITKKTKAIVPVHIYGNVCNMSEIMNIAKTHSLFVIEDTAEANFSTYKGRHAGTFGDFGSFSFQATKTITTGEGGALSTNNHEFENSARLIRNHGMEANKRYYHKVIGHNFRLTNMQAALGCAQLEHVTDIIKHKKRVYNRYIKNLSNQPHLQLQKISEDCDPVMWAITVKINLKAQNTLRDEIIRKMKEKNIETRPGFYSFHEMPIYRANFLPNSAEISKQSISLPSFTMISNNEIDYICETLISELNKINAK
jgi:perosamine synthetase